MYVCIYIYIYICSTRLETSIGGDYMCMRRSLISYFIVCGHFSQANCNYEYTHILTIHIPTPIYIYIYIYICKYT